MFLALICTLLEKTKLTVCKHVQKKLNLIKVWKNVY